MLVSDLHLLCCPDCRGALALGRVLDQDGDVLVNGTLSCPACRFDFPVIDTVVVLFRRGDVRSFLTPRETAFLQARGLHACLGDGADAGGGPDERLLATAGNWSYQWNAAVASVKPEDLEGDGYYGAKAFWTFIPVEPASVAGRIALSACGGFGREACHLVRAGAERVILNEIGDEIYHARHFIPDADRRTLLLRSDFSYLPVAAGSVDFAVCDHALQHVINHEAAFSRLVQTVRPGGRAAICVYSRENNVIMTHMVEPAKTVLHRIPLTPLRWLALVPALLVFALIHGLYRPLSRLAPALARLLPLASHMLFWAGFDFRTLWLAIFDLLHAPVSHHFPRSQVERMAADNGLEVLRLVNTNGTLWSLIGLVPLPR